MKNFTLLSILMFNIGLIFNINDITINSSPLDIQNTQSTSPCSNNTNNVRDKEGWTEIGDVVIRNVTNDSDNGDGNGDGAIEVVLESAGSDKGVFYTFDCVMVPNQTLQIETVIFNTRSSYVAVDLQLYNSTENRVIASKSEPELIRPGLTKTVSITYRTIDSDEGDQLQLRYLRNDDGNKVRVFSIDRVTIEEIETDTENTNTQTDTEDTTTPTVADTGTDTEDIDINTATTSPCSNNTNNVRDKEGWTEIGDVAIINVTNDSDNGDGNGDGAIEVVLESAGNDKGIFYTFDCVMVPNQALQIETVIFNTRSSYVAVDLQLYNSTENRVMASETETILVASTKTVSITYRTIDSDEGDQLQLRYLRKDDGNKVRVFSIDRVTISSSETEDSTEVETDTGTKNTDTQTDTEDTSASTVETPIEDTTTSAVADTGTDTEDIDINTATTSSCSNNTNNASDKEGWTEIGDVAIINVTNDNDNGDGNGDGAIEVVPESAGSDKGVFYTFDCVMVPNQTLQIETVIFNTRSSYVAVDLQLYNSTENRVIASKSESIGTDSNNSTKTVSITYRTIDSDEGDQLQLRYLRNDDGNKVRVFSIDRVTIEEIETDTENTNTQTDTEDTTTPTVADTGTDTEDIDINTATTSPCSNNTNNVRDKEGWTEIGDVAIINVTNDNDNGDGNGDGAIEVVPESAGSDKGVFYTFDCVMVPNQTLQIETVIFNTRSSYVAVDLQLYNSTENRVIASKSESIGTDSNNSTKTVSITYRTIDSDEGDQLQLRYLRKDDGNKARVFSIDRVTIEEVETDTDTEDIDINTATTSPCSNNTNNVRDKEGWTEIGDVVIRNVTNDSDNGDGNGDGAIEVVPESAGSDKGVFYTFDCVMVPNQTLQIETVIFNTRSSYVVVDLQLYNSTENRVMASETETILVASTKTVSITYRTIDSDEGDQLQLRYLRKDDGNKARVFSIDRVTISTSDNDNDNDEFSINQIPDTVNKNTSYTGPTPTFTLPTSNYLIYTISETCRNSNNGKINISVVDEMNYTATVTGTNGFTVTKTFTDKLEVDSLNAGIYSICFTVDKQSDYKQCFDLVINEPEDLSVSSKIDISLKRVSLSLKGADVYFVRLNETTYKTSDKKLQLQLKPGINTISVETAILCQGKFEEGIFVSEEIKYFPNPVESELFIYCAGVDTEVEIAVYDSLGRQLYIEPKKIGFNRVIRVPTDKLIPGIYVVSVKGKTTSKNFKIIK